MNAPGLDADRTCNCANGPLIDRTRLGELPLFSVAAAASRDTTKKARPVRKVKPAAKKRHIRERKATTVATLRMVDGVGFVLDVDDILTKNERHKVIIVGRPKAMGGKGQRAAPVPSPAALAYCEAVKVAAVECCGAAVLLGKGIRTGLWRLDIVSVWPTQRHHEDGTDTAYGDADAPVAMVKDALQYAGLIDDDMRIVVGSEASVYEKGVRRTVAVLRPITAEAHAASVAAVLGVLG